MYEVLEKHTEFNLIKAKKPSYEGLCTQTFDLIYLLKMQYFLG